MGEIRGSGVLLKGLRQAEVEDLDLALRGDLDVGGLQVAVDDAFFMCGFQSIRDPAADLQRFPSACSSQ
ncbi:MAG: hypothetical protein FJW35_16005 [Acidobacteria bacterium]|nr:hypothetical protein [Acidobacteriota bacterium]